MEEIEKFKLVHACESIDELKDAMDSIGDIKTRKGKIYTPENMKLLIDIAYHTGPINILTRNYGIRQQLLYILYYEKMEKLQSTIEQIKNN